MYLMTSTRCGISAKQLERELGVTYKTAWRMFTLIRNELMEQDPDQKLVEAGRDGRDLRGRQASGPPTAPSGRNRTGPSSSRPSSGRSASKRALRISRGSDGGKQVPIGLASPEQWPDAVVRKLVNPNAARFTRSIRLLMASVGRAVAHVVLVPGGDLMLRADQRASE